MKLARAALRGCDAGLPSVVVVVIVVLRAGSESERHHIVRGVWVTLQTADGSHKHTH
ncbi:hypothetical protein GCM10009773_27150 [Williamsia serinedens]